jgi:thymidylate kinase
MILLLEGTNCCGKSTLARSLAVDLGFEIVKFSMAPTTGTYDYFWDGLVGARRKHEHLIVDRAHLSNAVYGTLQGSGVLNPNEWQFIDQWFVQQRAWLFLMTDDVFRIEARVRERAREIDAPLGRPELAGIQREFEKFYCMSQIPTKGMYSLNLFYGLNGSNLSCDVEEPTDTYRKLVERLGREMSP